MTSSDPNGMLSGKSGKSKRLHEMNIRVFYLQIPQEIQKSTRGRKVF
jgi:hypothetical protein